MEKDQSDVVAKYTFTDRDSGAIESTVLREFFDTFPFDPSIAEAYGRDIGALYATGLPVLDGALEVIRAKGRPATAHDFDQDYRAVADKDFAGRKSTTGFTYDHDWNARLTSNEVRENLQLLALNPGPSLYAARVSGSILSQMYYHYAPYMRVRPSKETNTLAALNLTHSYPEEDFPEQLSPIEISQYLYSKGFGDLSETILLDRFETFLRIANFELAAFGIGNVRELGRLGDAQGRRAYRLFEQYNASLYTTDLGAKLNLIENIRDIFQEYANPRSPKKRKGPPEYMQTLATRADNLLVQMHTFLEDMQTVFTSLGYASPDALLSLHGIAAAPEAVTPTEVQTEVDPITTTPEELATRGAARARLAELEKRITRHLDRVILPTDGTQVVSPQEFFEKIVASELEASEGRPTADKTDAVQRLLDLHTIGEILEAEIFRTEQGALGKRRRTYFACIGNFRGQIVVIAESIDVDNGTYAAVGDDALEILSLPKQEALDAGAVMISHSPQASESHPQRVIGKLEELIPEAESPGE